MEKDPEKRKYAGVSWLHPSKVKGKPKADHEKRDAERFENEYNPDLTGSEAVAVKGWYINEKKKRVDARGSNPDGEFYKEKKKKKGFLTRLFGRDK